jgi:hypothetical protein
MPAGARPTYLVLEIRSDEEETMGRATTWGRTAMAGLALMVSLALAGCGSHGGSASHAASAVNTTQTNTTSSIEQPTPITAAEQQWLLAVTQYQRRVNGAVENLGLITESSLRRTATVFDGCRAALRSAGDAGRFQPAAELAQRACETLHKAAADLRRTKGYDDIVLVSIDAADLERVMKEVQRYNRLINGGFAKQGAAGKLLAKAIVKAQRIKQTFGD